MRPRSFFVSGVCCAAEEAQVRKAVEKVTGSRGYTFNAFTCELCVLDHGRGDLVARALNEAGFGVRSKQELEQPLSWWGRHQEGVRTAVAALLAGAGILLDQGGAYPPAARVVLLGAILLGGWRIFARAWKSLRTPAFDMHVLMTAAVVGALAIDRWTEGAAVIVLFAVSLMLEQYSAARTRRAIQSLLSISPEQASVLSEGRERTVKAGEVLPGQVIVVRPGERIPLDGTVIEGTSFVDESIITGESVPLQKEAGENVYAGSINQRGSLLVRTTRQYEDTTLARIVHLIEEAQRKRAPVQDFVERFSRVYTPAVLAIAAVTAVAPPLLLGQPFGEWFYRALVILVIACPCALVISTPVTIVSALAWAARHGILIKGGRQIEMLSRVEALAFDKTGTLTHGRPAVTDVVPLNSLNPRLLVQIVAALEHRSEHPLASAFVAEAARQSVDYRDVPLDGFEALPGLGVTARVRGERFYLGNRQLSERERFWTSDVDRAVGRLEQEGKTAVILGRQGEPLGVLAVRDVARRSSSQAIAALRGLGVKHMALLSGDHETSAQQVVEEVGLDESRAGLLPEEKVRAVEELKSRHGTVAMVGDGINDAPALAASSVGIAMGVRGADAALETADVVLMGDDLSKLPVLLKLSKKAMTIVKQNVALALSLKLLFLILSGSGVATLWMAVLADDGAAFLVILNGLRILSAKAKA